MVPEQDCYVRGETEHAPSPTNIELYSPPKENFIYLIP